MSESTECIPRIRINATHKNQKPIEYYIDKNGCHICISHHKDNWGYPLCKRKGINTHISRHIYSMLRGSIPEGMIVRHTCDNPSCINPEHLLLGTQKDNMKDMRIRSRENYSKNEVHRIKHLGEKNANAKLTEKQARRIKVDKKTSTKELMKIFGLAKSSICRIRSGKSWKHIKV